MVWSGLFNQIGAGIFGGDHSFKNGQEEAFLHYTAAILSSFGMFWDSCEIGVRWISCVASRSQTHLLANMEGVCEGF